MPAYHDFALLFTGGRSALRGEAVAVCTPEALVKAQEAIVGAGHALFSNWPYPPIYFLILAPFAALPYILAFFVSGFVTLAGYVAVVYLIVRRRPAIALALASPFAAWNFIAGQTGAVTAALLGGALLSLECRPVLAGVFIGCLTYKTQWGILIPVALLAAGQWRAIASAVVTAALLGGLSIVFFGIEPWLAFQRALWHRLT